MERLTKDDPWGEDGDLPEEEDVSAAEQAKQAAAERGALTEAARIHRIVEPFRDCDPKQILNQAAGPSAALLMAVATGVIPAPLSLRISAAKNIIDRVEGTPVQQVVIEDRRKVDFVMEGLQRLEQIAREHHEPLTLIPPLTSREIGAMEQGQASGSSVARSASPPEAAPTPRAKTDEVNSA